MELLIGNENTLCHCAYVVAFGKSSHIIIQELTILCYSLISMFYIYLQCNERMKVYREQFIGIGFNITHIPPGNKEPFHYSFTVSFHYRTL